MNWRCKFDEEDDGREIEREVRVLFLRKREGVKRQKEKRNRKKKEKNIILMSGGNKKQYLLLALSYNFIYTITNVVHFLYKIVLKITIQLFSTINTDTLRALTTVKLNSYIAILVLPKHKNPYYSSGVKGKFFTFIATMHSYIWLCTVAKS